MWARSALHLAAERGHPELVSLLVAAGAAIDARDRCVRSHNSEWRQRGTGAATEKRGEMK